MSLLRLTIIIIFFFSCNTEPIREEVQVGRTIKIEASSFPTSNNSYNYLWSKPKGPEGHNCTYKIENNKMLFTPNMSGNYDITLLVESFDKTNLYEETFTYSAIGNKLQTTNVVDLKNEIPENIRINTTRKEKQSTTVRSYTIQVASWPDIESARIDQLELSKQGYDSYLEQYYIKSKDQTWWRVRVGHFTDRSKAEIIKKSLSNIKGSDLWIDFIKE